jgi:hypothetical protein
MEYNNCCVALDYFPEMNSLIYASLESGSNGSVIQWSKTTNEWSRIGAGKDLPIGAYHHFSEYNPVHKVMIFGGGNGSSDVYQLDSLGTITALANGPVNIGINSTVFTTDPVSGQHLLFTNDETFYTFDVPSNTWTLQDVPRPSIFDNRDEGSFGIVATPVSTYGVIMFVYWAYAESRIYLYKHSYSAAGSKDYPEKIIFSSSTVRLLHRYGFPRFSLYLTERQEVSIRLYTTSGAHTGTAVQEIMEKGTHEVNWSPPASEPQVYIAVVRIGNTATTIKTIWFNRRKQ